MVARSDRTSEQILQLGKPRQAETSLSESRLEVDVRRADKLGECCGIDLTIRPELHVAPAVARSLEQANRVVTIIRQPGLE